jgi:hypothetical protein
MSTRRGFMTSLGTSVMPQQIPSGRMLLPQEVTMCPMVHSFWAPGGVAATGEA